MVSKLEIILNKVFSKKELLTEVKSWKSQNQKIIFTNGVFDLLHRGLTFTNTSSGADSFYWDIGDGFTFITTSDSVYQHTYSDQDTATYLIELVVANTFGCLDSIAHEVIVFGDHALFVPNAFSPNNDFINDTFFPKVIGIDEDNFEMLIFDR